MSTGRADIGSDSAGWTGDIILAAHTPGTDISGFAGEAMRFRLPGFGGLAGERAVAAVSAAQDGRGR